MKTSDVRKIIYDPLLDNKNKIIEYLIKQEPFTGHRHGNELIVWTGTKIETIDLSMTSDNFFIDESRRSELEGSINFNEFHQILEYQNWEIVPLNKEDYFTINVNPKNKIVYCLSSKTPTYFDFVVYSKKHKKPLTYNNTHISNLSHSGDINRGSHLLHYCVDDRSIDELVLAVNGYNRTPLHRWKNSIPTMYMLDYDTETLYIVPLPLDKSTIGEATLAGMVHMKSDGRGMFKCHVLERPILVDNVDTGFHGKRILDKLDRTFGCSLDPPEKIESGAGKKTSSAPIKVVQSSKKPLVKGPIVFCQNANLDNIELPKHATIINFGQNGFSYDVGELTDQVGIPSFFPISGPLAGLCNKEPSTVQIDYDNMIFPMIHVSDKWIDSTIDNVMIKMNGCMVIHPNKPFTGNNTRDEIETYMNDICVNARAMIDQRSIILIEIKGDYYWYSGIQIDGFMETMPKYGNKVTKYFDSNMMDLFYKQNLEFPWPKYVSKDDTSVYFKGKLMDPMDFVNSLLPEY